MDIGPLARASWKGSKDFRMQTARRTSIATRISADTLSARSALAQINENSCLENSLVQSDAFKLAYGVGSVTEYRKADAVTIDWHVGLF